MSKNTKRFCLATVALASATLGLIPQEFAWAISGGDIKIETNHSVYNKGDDVKLEIKIKTNDNSSFLLQSDIQWSSGMTLKSVSGDNIQYNRGKIIGTAPQTEFVINVTLNVHGDSDQTVQLTNVKMGAVDGSLNYTIDKSEKVIDIKESAVEDTKPTEPPTEVAPPDEEPSAPTEPEKPEPPKEPEVTYTAWKATVTVSDNLNVREGPGLNYKIIGKLYDGDHVTVTNEQKGGDITWLKVERGWISKDYVVEGHIEKPEKTDEEIEKEQQEQIKNEAENSENENQANNEAAQKKDEDKKEEYDRQEQASATTPTAPEESETNTDAFDEVEGIEQNLPHGEESETPLDIDDSTLTVGINPITTEEGSSYAQYLTPAMSKPFYLYLESYSLQFPDGFEKVSQDIGGLSFLMATPSDISIKKPNVFLAFGSYNKEEEPLLYYFDRDTDSFFPYEKMLEKTVVIDKTIEYEKKTITKSHIACGILGILGIYGAGAFTTALCVKKKEKKKAKAEPQKIVHTKPAPKKTYKPDPEAVKDMSDEDLEELLKVYGASTADVVKKNAQRADTAHNTHKATAQQNTMPPASPKMEWDTLSQLMQNPEQIKETPAPQKTEKPVVKECVVNETNNTKTASTTETIAFEPIKNENLKEEKHTVAADTVECESEENPETIDVENIDLKFEKKETTEIDISALQEKLDKAEQEFKESNE